MAYPYYDHPGNIRTQIGTSLNAIRDMIRAKDVEGEADQVRLLIALCAPKIAPEARAKLKLPSRPARERDRDGRFARELHHECMRVLEDVLQLLAAEGIYAKLDVAPSDGSDLALQEDDETPVTN